MYLLLVTEFGGSCFETQIKFSDAKEQISMVEIQCLSQPVPELVSPSIKLQLAS